LLEQGLEEMFLHEFLKDVEIEIEEDEEKKKFEELFLEMMLQEEEKKEFFAPTN